ncbi:hypothetical protein BDV11DRAFT_216150 [Aspergillus similis]
MAATCVGPPLANGLQPLSCLRCAHRKVRCDRVVPCSNWFVASPPRNKLRPRLERYNEALRNLSVDVESIADSLQGPVAEPTQPDKTPWLETHDTPAGLGGRLFVVGSRSRYIEGELWTRISKAQGAMFGTRIGSGVSRLPLRLSPKTPLLEPVTFYPTQERFRQLWQIYLANIHPITMILHAPSASETLANTVNNSGNSSKDTEALLFATMVCALNSITDAECERLLGEKKSVLLSIYCRGCEIALTKANLLVSSNFGVLQAFTLYLVAIGPHVNPCLHQELSTADLSPFDLEMRRRLWSRIVMQDTLSAQGVGLHWQEPGYNVPPPHNINDADLSLDMRAPPEERVGATDMIFCILLHKVMVFMGQVYNGRAPWAFAAGENWTAAVDHLYRAEREKAVTEMENELELQILRYCDMLNPVHFFTVIVARLTLCKMRYMMLQPCQSGQDRPDGTGKVRETVFLAALKVLEYENNANSQLSIQGFLWHWHQHSAWSCLIHVLEYLKARPCGEHVDNAWEQIRIFYDGRPSLTHIRKRRVPLYTGINTMAIEAWQIRETKASERGQILVSPAFITGLRARVKGQPPTAHLYKSQTSSTINISQTLREQPLNQGPLSTNSSFTHTPENFLNWTDVTMAASSTLGNCSSFLDPILDREILMSAGTQNNCSLYSSQMPMPPINPCSPGGWSIS